jgi:predicted GIY-YIG superfamily endonuclease
MLFIYILELENNKYYIGKTTNPNFRLEQHFNNCGSLWTQKYKPIKVLEIIDNCDDYDEDKYTLKYMQKYGVNNVRGGSFCEINLSNSNTKTIQKMLASSSDKCYICGKKGHFAKECQEKNKNESWDFFSLVTSAFTSSLSFVYSLVSNYVTQEEKDKKIICFKCKRKGHYANKCYAKTDIYGKNL